MNKYIHTYKLSTWMENYTIHQEWKIYEPHRPSLKRSPKTELKKNKKQCTMV